MWPCKFQSLLALVFWFIEQVKIQVLFDKQSKTALYFTLFCRKDYKNATKYNQLASKECQLDFKNNCSSILSIP